MQKIMSMTGFGRCEMTEGTKRVCVEIKSVNHRYLDISIKMPKKLNFFDAALRNVLKEYMQRGKIDIFITYEDSAEAGVTVSYHPEVAAEYLKYLKQMKEQFGLEDDVRISSLSRYPEVFTLDEMDIDEEGIWRILEKTVRGAAENFVETRKTEGENLRADLLTKLDEMAEITSFIEERSPVIIEEYKKTLTAKVKDMLADSRIDESRILTEVVIYADKVCVDEELVRLKSHIEAVKSILLEGGGIGRKLDFMAQEMNREANTILSKTDDLEISNKGIELKTGIEKVREQIQNIE